VYHKRGNRASRSIVLPMIATSSPQRRLSSRMLAKTHCTDGLANTSAGIRMSSAVVASWPVQVGQLRLSPQSNRQPNATDS